MVHRIRLRAADALTASLALVVAASMALVAPALASADDATTTTLTLPATQPVHGQTATLTATVNDTTTPATVPVGSVQFSVDGSTIGTSPLSGHTAQIVTPALTAGQHPVQAAYVPSVGFSSSNSGTAMMTVAKAATTTLLQITPSTGVAGQDLAVVASVTPTTPPLGAPSGTVTFYVGGQRLASDTLDPDGATRGTLVLPAVSLTITVVYEGDNNYAGSSGSASVTINKAGTVIALTSSPNPATVGQDVTFTMQVNALAPSKWNPFGVLNAAVDGQPAPATWMLDDNVRGGQFTASFGAAGVHHVTAHFAGDEDALDADAALNETINAQQAGAGAGTQVAARGLSLAVAPKRDRSKPYRFAVSGTLLLPSGVAKADGCAGKVNIEAKMKAKRVARKSATVSSSCRFKASITAPRKGAVSITATFAGNARIAAVGARAVKVTAG